MASRFDDFGFGRGTHSGYGFAENGTGILGLGSASGERGDRSGTGSRRHSVSIVGRRGLPVPSSSGGGNSYGSGWGGGFGGGSSRGGFSDEDLATGLGNALNLNLDDSTSGSYLDRHYHVPSSSASYTHPASLPIFAPSSPSSYSGFQQPQSYLQPSSLRVPTEHRGVPFPDRPQSKSRSASFGGEHGTWSNAIEDDDDEVEDLGRRLERGRGRVETPSSVGSGRAERSISRGLPTLSSLGRGTMHSPSPQQLQSQPSQQAAQTQQQHRSPSFSSGGPPAQPGGYYPYAQQPHALAPQMTSQGFRPPPPSTGQYGSMQGGFNPYQQGLPSPIGAPTSQPGFSPSGGSPYGLRQPGAFAPSPSSSSPFSQHGARLPPPPPSASAASPFPTFYPQPQHQRHLSSTVAPTSASDLMSNSPAQGTSLTELGKGLPLSAVPSTTPLYIVEFKAGRTDLFYCPDPTQLITTGDLVIVEADRGKDLGKVVNDQISLDEVKRFQEQQAELAFLAQQVGLGGQSAGGPTGQGVGVVNSVTVRGLTKEIMPKRIYSKAMPLDAQSVRSPPFALVKQQADWPLLWFSPSDCSSSRCKTRRRHSRSVSRKSSRRSYRWRSLTPSTSG